MDQRGSIWMEKRLSVKHAMEYVFTCLLGARVSRPHRRDEGGTPLISGACVPLGVNSYQCSIALPDSPEQRVIRTHRRQDAAPATAIRDVAALSLRLQNAQAAAPLPAPKGQP